MIPEKKKKHKIQEFERKPATKESFMDDEDFKNTSVIAWMKMCTIHNATDG